MTETEKERDMNQAATPQLVWCLSLRYLIAPSKPAFYLMLLEKTQLYKCCKWTFDLTMHNLIVTLDLPQTSRFNKRYKGVAAMSGSRLASMCKKQMI